MAYVPVPKDLSKVKTKVAFNLTKRQLICFAAALGVGLPLFFLLKDSAGTSLAAMAMIVVMLPCFLFAMYEKHGQPLEVMVKNIIQTTVYPSKGTPLQDGKLYTPSWNGRENLKRRYQRLSKGTAQQQAREAARKGKSASSPAPKRNRLKPLYRQAKGDGKAHTAQQTIPYLQMYPDGICKVTEKKYSKSIAFEDINYQLAQAATTRPPFLKTGATSSTTLTLP